MELVLQHVVQDGEAFGFEGGAEVVREVLQHFVEEGLAAGRREREGQGFWEGTAEQLLEKFGFIRREDAFGLDGLTRHKTHSDGIADQKPAGIVGHAAFDFIEGYDGVAEPVEEGRICYGVGETPVEHFADKKGDGAFDQVAAEMGQRRGGGPFFQVGQGRFRGGAADDVEQRQAVEGGRGAAALEAAHEETAPARGGVDGVKHGTVVGILRQMEDEDP